MSEQPQQTTNPKYVGRDPDDWTKPAGPLAEDQWEEPMSTVDPPTAQHPVIRTSLWKAAYGPLSIVYIAAHDARTALIIAEQEILEGSITSITLDQPAILVDGTLCPEEPEEDA